MRKGDPSLTGADALWHECYCRWYDHDRAGHKIRAMVWGVLTNGAAWLT